MTNIISNYRTPKTYNKTSQNQGPDREQNEIYRLNSAQMIKSKDAAMKTIFQI